jgi:hypothetical protein
VGDVHNPGSGPGGCCGKIGAVVATTGAEVTRARSFVVVARASGREVTGGATVAARVVVVVTNTEDVVKVTSVAAVVDGTLPVVAVATTAGLGPATRSVEPEHAVTEAANTTNTAPSFRRPSPTPRW